MSPLLARMTEDITPAGSALGTQKLYAPEVYRLAAHYRPHPIALTRSARRGKRCGATCSACANGGSHAAPSRPVIPAVAQRHRQPSLQTWLPVT